MTTILKNTGYLNERIAVPYICCRNVEEGHSFPEIAVEDLLPGIIQRTWLYQILKHPSVDFKASHFRRRPG
uniref:Uncharacterized protein n=1 Tax=Candidatus Kentrum sp. TC TaxID=2126339 RepID=A0A450YT85_9GAMM|nr:MAG: hypothetical protein BECKTC1821D_GA0114238_102115 [Candidatus Kentron sp. TC]